MAGTQNSNWAGKTYQECEWHHRQRVKMEQSWEEDAHTTGLPSAVSPLPDLHDVSDCAPSDLGLCLTADPEAQIQVDMEPWAKINLSSFLEIFILEYPLQGGKGRLTCPAALDSASAPLCSSVVHRQTWLLSGRAGWVLWENAEKAVFLHPDSQWTNISSLSY